MNPGRDAEHGTAHTDVLARLSPSDTQDLFALGQLHRFAKGEFVCRAGSPGKNVYFLRKGRVKIYQPSQSGKEVLLWFCFTGEMFGLAEVAQGGGRIVNAQACEDTEVLSLSQKQLAMFLETHPHAGLLIMQVIASRLRALGDVVVNLINDDVQTRIMKLILRLGARHGVRVGQDIYLNIHFTHQEIADMVGTTRQTVTSVLSELKRQGLMSLESRRIHIESMELLDEMTHPT
jgi:CRP/FNR family transcriptional regulator